MWKALQAKPSFLSLCYYSFLTLVHAAIYEAQEETSRLLLSTGLSEPVGGRILADLLTILNQGGEGGGQNISPILLIAPHSS